MGRAPGGEGDQDFRRQGDFHGKPMRDTYSMGMTKKLPAFDMVAPYNFMNFF
jgi:hypothetical protein